MARQIITACQAILLIFCLCWALQIQAWPSLKDGSRTHVPAVGKLLVAMPKLQDPRFRRTVILLIRSSPRGVVGLIVNRPTRLTLQTEFEEWVSEPRSGDPLYWGGPVAMNRRVMLVEQSLDDRYSQQQEPLLEQLYLAHNMRQFEQVLKQPKPQQRFRIYAGYAGWGARQLEREIARGDWLVLSGSADLVLQTDTEAIWPQLINYRHDQMAAREFNVAQIEAPAIDVGL
jgi:putative transcriptional regulator